MTNPQGLPVYGPDSWDPEIERLIAAEFTLVNGGVSREWLEIESDGNPGAIGEPGQLGPDGNPREIGLGQLYNPDDFAAQGIAVAPFRAYCVGLTQQLSRALTQDERDQQVRCTLLWKIEQGRAAAELTCQRYALPWPSTAADYWKLVKAPHAYPRIATSGLPAVVKKLGRAPSSWDEFRSVLGMDRTDAQLAAMDAASASVFRTWTRALNACEACGNAYSAP
jgi:hypothetical protein